MLAFTVKNYIKNLIANTHGNDYILEFKGNETEHVYKFKVEKDILTLTLSKDGQELLYTSVNNIDKLFLCDNRLEPVFLTETKFKEDGSLYERVEKSISYPAQLYITLFNLMHKKANFTFRHSGKHFRCYYIEGKTLVVEQNAKEYIIRGTNLNHLNTLYDNYEILYVSPLIRRLTYRDFLSEQEVIAETLNKEFIKYKLNERVG